MPIYFDNQPRCSLEGRLFPAIVPQEGAVVRGLLCELETQADMDIFDDFEDEQYIRTEVLGSDAVPTHEVHAYAFLHTQKYGQHIHVYIYIYNGIYKSIHIFKCSC